MDRLVDLDMAAAEVERRRGTWTANGLVVGPLTWRDAAEQWPWTLHTDRSEVRDPDSVGVSVKCGQVEGAIVLFRGGWADVVLGVAAPPFDPVVEAPDVPDVAAFGAVLDSFNERVLAAQPE